MLAYLRGVLQSKQAASSRAIIEISGVGFLVNVSPRTLSALPEAGEEAIVYTSLAVRENDWTLFGFATEADKEMFELLQSVSGVGPKMALGLVGTLGADELAQAISCDDQKMVSQAPGVGAKMAQRIILELKSKVDQWADQRPASAPSFKSKAVAAEVRSILAGLGYTPTEINLALKQTQEAGADEDVENMVRLSLKVLSAQASS